MKMWGQHLKSETEKSKLTNSEAKRALTLRFGVAVLAIAVMASLATFTFTKSATAAAVGLRLRRRRPWMTIAWGRCFRSIERWKLWRRV